VLKKRIRESLQAWHDPNEIKGIDALPRLIELGHSHGSLSVNGHGASLVQKLSNTSSPIPWSEGDQVRLRSAVKFIPADN